MAQQNIKRFCLCRWRKNPNNDGTSSWESQIKVDGQLRYVLVSAEVSLFGPLCSLYFQEAHEGEMLSSRWVSPGRNVCKTRINQSLISLTNEIFFYFIWVAENLNNVYFSCWKTLHFSCLPSHPRQFRTLTYLKKGSTANIQTPPLLWDPLCGVPVSLMAEVCCCPRESIRRTYGSNDQNAQAFFPHHNRSSRYVKGTCEETIQHGSLIDNLKNNKNHWTHLKL